ncbi:hypothetical protein PAXRUDRAFT_563978 [Paxillus rubicundulus Ve08.2h10]|uniref:Uncharacterized protein n=1 Tax=Paxillus rubicundulus Ve08.2h10 TaxID=930991 RepID=A0A0D0CF21_9AGAM|nr:hypothetical protein PAXRUDRAFT_563978 [Paxillus rubicundulus Ve08.2h10]
MWTLSHGRMYQWVAAYGSCLRCDMEILIGDCIMGRLYTSAEVMYLQRCLVLEFMGLR